MAKMYKLALISGGSVPVLSFEVAHELNMNLIQIENTQFSDGELSIEINDHIRNKDVYIIQSTCAPVNDHLMQLVLMSDAARRSAARSVTAVIPYFGYGRQDRRPDYHRTPISARVVADIISKVANVSQVITVDIHSAQIQGFFSGIPVINLGANPVLFADIWRNNYYMNDIVIVSPDAGGVKRARALTKELHGVDLAIIDKRRSKANSSEVMNVLGDVEGRRALIVDDLIDTAGTLCNAAVALKENGAVSVAAYCTHPVLSGPALERIAKSPVDEVVVTDTIQLSEEAINCGKIRVVSMAGVLAETIRRVQMGESISSIIL